jgi:hypothetical protein
MANIFAGQFEMPDWMRGLGAENRKVAGQFGQILGTDIAAATLMATDKDVDPLTGQEQPLSFGAAYQRARANQVDPMAGIKAQQMKLNAYDSTFKLKATSMALDDAQKERADKLDDLPTMREWMKLPNDDESKWTNLPAVKSQWGQQQVDAQVRQNDGRQFKEQQLENQRLSIQNRLDLETMREKAKADQLATAKEADQTREETRAAGVLHAAEIRNQGNREKLDAQMEMLKYSKLPAAQHAKLQGILKEKHDLNIQSAAVLRNEKLTPAEKTDALNELHDQIQAADEEWRQILPNETAPPSAGTDPGDVEAMTKLVNEADAKSAAAAPGPESAKPVPATRLRYDPVSGKLFPVTK